MAGFALRSNGVEFLIISGAEAQEASLHILTMSLTTQLTTYFTFICINATLALRCIDISLVTMTVIGAICVLTEAMLATDHLILTLINIFADRV